MVERICPSCQHGNPLEDRFCGKCGASLERMLPATRGASSLVLAGRQLPVTWQQVGKTVALSAAALAAEVGMAWLKRRLEQTSPTTLASNSVALARRPQQTEAPARAGSVVTIISRRVIDIWEQADGHRRIVEHHEWKKIEE